MSKNTTNSMTMKEWIEMVMASPTASPYAKHLAHIIFHRWDEKTNTCSVSASDFARLTSLSMSTVQRYINELGNFVEKVEKGKGRSPNKFYNEAIVVTSDSYSYGVVTSERHNKDNPLVTSEGHNKDRSYVSETQQKENLGGDYRGGEERLSVTSIDLTNKIDHTQENDQIKKFDRSLSEKKSSPEKPKAKRWTQAQIDAEFDKFWNECPRKIGKVKAREKFELLIREKVRRGRLIEAKVTPEELTRAMASFASRHDGDDVKFIPHPTTWLNQERWVDEREAEKKNSEAWGWWRHVAGMDSLSLEDWRETIRQCKPNGTWPWEKLGPPPGHPECLMPAEAQAAYGDKYAAQNEDLIKQFGGGE